MLERFVKNIIEREGRRTVVEIPIDSVSVNPYQPRRHFNEEKLNELAQSIRELGVIQPVIVRPLGTGYELVSGERRLRACKIAGLKTIPAIVTLLDDQDVMEITFIENLQREQLDEVEKAEAYGRLIRENEDIDIIAERVGKTPAAFKKKLWMARLPQVVKKALSKKLITTSQARLISQIESEKKQLALLEEILKRNASDSPPAEMGKKARIEMIEACLDIMRDIVSSFRKSGVDVAIQEIISRNTINITLSFPLDSPEENPPGNPDYDEKDGIPEK